jgi:hypothetical protein
MSEASPASPRQNPTLHSVPINFIPPIARFSHTKFAGGPLISA